MPTFAQLTDEPKQPSGTAEIIALTGSQIRPAAFAFRESVR
jgi:hypothetical protein